MTLKLNGSSSGYTAIDAAAAAGNNTLTLPTHAGTLSTGYILHTDGVSVGTGTTKAFTGIPAANHIKIIHWGLSFAGSDNPRLKIGNATDGIKSADYFAAAVDHASTHQSNSYTSYWQLYGANESAKSYTGQIDIWRIGTGNVYSMNWNCTTSQSTGDGTSKIQSAHGFVESTTINQIEFSGGTFDSGAITIYHI